MGLEADIDVADARKAHEMAAAAGLLSLEHEVDDLRRWGVGRHQQVDDTPFDYPDPRDGGGP